MPNENDDMYVDDSIIQQEPSVLPISKDDMSKTIKAFVEDEKLENFEQILQNFFSKHILLSFLDERDIGLLMLQFDSALNYYIINHNLSFEDLMKIDQIRMMFFSALKRAKGRRDNERELLSKNVTEHISSYNQPIQERRGLRKWLFG